MSWYFVMAAEVKEDYAFSLSELPPTRGTFPATFMKAISFTYDIRTGDVSSIGDVTTSSVLTIRKCGKNDFMYMVIAPYLPNGVAVLGELNKFVTVSETRFLSLDVTGDRVFARIAGVPSEKVSITLSNQTTIWTTDCVIGDTGFADLSITPEGSCS